MAVDLWTKDDVTSSFGTGAVFSVGALRQTGPVI
jgi:hypothetical protein